MNTNMITRLLPFLLVCLLIISCTHTEEEQELVPVGTTEIDINTRSIPATDECFLYIFKKEGSNPYKLLQTVSLPSGSATVSLNNADLVASNQFRFLYVSQPTSISNGVIIKKNGGSTLAAGDLWTDVRIEAQSQDLNGGIYYKIDAYAGNTLASMSTISTTLLRLAGQQVIDIYKVDNGDLDDPVDVSGNVYSVLDRVIEIKLTYTGLTKTIGFNETTAAIEIIDTWGTYTQTKTLIYETTPGANFLKVNLTANGIANATIKLPDSTIKTPGGSARIMGVWGLTATNTVRILGKFSYYHTTPTLCSDANPETHVHTEACYPKKDKNTGVPTTDALFLNLPKPSSPAMSIVPNVYTITKAGIRYDRIIDVGASGGFGFITNWDNGNVGP